MYFPLLRARQYELLALRATVGKNISKELIKPIIEPVVEGTRDIYRFCEELFDVEAGFIFIVNPSKGHFTSHQQGIINLISECVKRNPLIEFALRIDNDTSIKQVDDFIELYSEYPVSLIHESNIEDVEQLRNSIDVENFAYNIFRYEGTQRTYRGSFKGWNNIILRDSFNRVEPNSAYEGEEFFSNTVYTYSNNGYFGFGDYSVIGDYFSTGGGGAKACAIHITYENNDEEVWIKHFLSNPRDHVEDGSTLASEAIETLVIYIKANWQDSQYTNAIREFIEMYDTGRQTSLAFVKKLAIMHHLELMDNILDR